MDAQKDKLRKYAEFQDMEIVGEYSDEGHSGKNIKGDKKISDLQRRLDVQYDRIDEVEETMTELKSQIYELKKNQIDADSIYGFLGAFKEKERVL